MTHVQEVLKRNGYETKAEAKPGDDKNGAPGGKADDVNDDLNDDEKGEKKDPPPAEKKDAPPASEKKDTPPKNTTEEVDLDETQLIAQLAKKGISVKALNELNKPEVKTPEQIEADAQQKRDEMRQFALRSKKVSSTEFDNYVKETNIPVKDLAFTLYKKERLDELKTAKVPADQLPDDKALRDEFDEAHFQYADENDPKRKNAEKLLNKTVNDYIDDKYSSIINLESEYDNHMQSTEKKGAYNSIVESVVGSIGDEMEFEIPINKGKFPFKFKVTPDRIKAIKELYLSDASFGMFGQNANEEMLKAAVRGNIIQAEFDNILSEGAIAYYASKVEDIQKGRRGIKPDRDESGSGGGEKKVNKVVQGILQNKENQKVLNS